MNYTIDIIDTLDDTHVTVLESAEAKSIVLEWHGDPVKDGNPIVGSSLSFSMEVHTSTGVDGQFRHLFTGNESRYKVVKYLTDTPEVIVWTGFLLPDRYSEPYTNGTFYPRFQAACGLGRLKGKFLDADFYTLENSVTDIICACLELTGHQLPVNVAPAIENVSVKNYNAIYLDGAEFVTDGRNMDAYTVLQKVVGDMVCTVYQADNQWWVEGLNHRHLKFVPFYNYDYDGTFNETATKEKLEKTFEGIGVPQIDIIPPYSEVYVSHERRPQALPEEIALEKNENWAVGQGVDGDINPTHWFGESFYYPKALAPDYKVVLPTLNATAFDVTNKIRLKRKIYVKKYDKLVFLSEFKSPVSARVVDAPLTANGVRLVFKLNGDVVYSVERSFDDTELAINFDLYVSENGLLDVEIWQPYFSGTLAEETYAPYISIEKFTMQVVGFASPLTYSDVLNDDFTVGKEVELGFADDATGFSSAFRLAKLDMQGTAFYTVTVPILYNRTFQGRNYAIVSLYGANLIADNKTTVLHGGNPINILNVFYNYLGGEEMVVETVLPVTGNFTVQVYDIKDHTADRTHWEQWTDAIYPIERDRYHVSVGKVYRRLFVNAHERVTYTAQNAIKFNDLIKFDYILPSNYFVASVAWNVDAGTSEVTMIKCVYQNNEIQVGDGDNIPPLVNAGNDTVLHPDFGVYNPLFGYLTLYHNSPEAYDPDGFINSYIWSVESGDPNAVINGRQQLYPTLVRFDGPELVLRLTVKDDRGATAFDTVKFTKQFGNALSLVEESEYRNITSTFEGLSGHSIAFSPDLAENAAITIKGSYGLEVLYETFLSQRFIVSFSVYKNGVRILYDVLEVDAPPLTKTGDFEFNYIDGDNVELQIYGLSFRPDGDARSGVYFKAEYEITNVVFQSGAGTVTGYPVGNTLLFQDDGWVS